MPASPQTQVRMGIPRRRNAGIGSPGCSTQLALRLTPRISLGPAHRGTFMTGVKFREKIRIRGVVRKKKKRLLSGLQNPLCRPGASLLQKMADRSREEAVWGRHTGALHKWVHFTSPVLSKGSCVCLAPEQKCC